MSGRELDLPPLDAELARLMASERARPGLSAGAQAALMRGLEDALGLPPPAVGDGGGPPAPDAPSGASAAPAASAAATGASDAMDAASAGASALGGRVVALVLAAFVGGGIAGSAATRWPSRADVASRRVSEVRVAALEVALGSMLENAHDEPREEMQVPFATLPAPAPETSGRAPPASHERANDARPVTASGASSAAAGEPARDASLAAERRLLDIARTAVGRGKNDAALEALARHASEFPRGRLGEEREALRVQALVAAGRHGEARERSESFRQTYPRSMLLRALEVDEDGAKP